MTAVVLGAARASHARGAQPIPDLTKGGTKDNKHDWTLGPTGARGWMWGRNLETTRTRQILVTKVDKGSPADGILREGDVILGVDGKLFTKDARKVFARAVTEAERRENGGRLRLVRWRDGNRRDVTVTIPAIGAYSRTAPFDCPKTAKIIDAACAFLAKRGFGGGVPGNVNALGALATGRPEFREMTGEHARKVAPPDMKLGVESGGMAAWGWGYANLFLTEYYLVTKDASVLPAIREYSVNIARGQSGVGTWGHGMAWTKPNGGKLHGPLGGYGALNQAGLICFMSLALAGECGVRHPEIDAALAQATKFFGFYINKGAIPYGDHRPGWSVHDDNGKCSIASVIFDLLGNEEGATFFSRMSVASYGVREAGHTGNYFSILWGPLGAARAGPEAVAAFMKESHWFLDMERKWDGGSHYQGGAGMGGGEHQYGRWDCTGARLLAHCLPLRKLRITGRGDGVAARLTGAELKEVIEASRGLLWSTKDDLYRDRDTEELFGLLGSWSPVVRFRAAKALSRKTEPSILPRAIRLLDGRDLNTRYGACMTLEHMKAKAAPGVPALIEQLSHRDLWLRIRAVYALAGIGTPAREAVPELLKLALREYDDDPREFTQRFLCFGLFYPGGALRMNGLLSRSLEGVDRALLFRVVEKLLKNDDGRARGCISSIYDKLTFEEIEPLIPAIHRAIIEPAPSGVMFASGIRLRGIKFLVKHRIREGMALCIETMDIESWGKNRRIGEGLKMLKGYGAAAKAVLPELKELMAKLRAHREKKMMAPHIKTIEKMIADLQRAEDVPRLRSIADYIK
jgi:hypothetical protein